MPLQRRIPKRGFKNIFKKEFAIVNLDIIDALKDDAVITPELLIEKGVIKKMKDGLKVLAKGSIQRPVTIKANAFSTSAAAKIEAAGGKTEVI
jgi:large subunit ribosomal protein L15